MTGRVRGRCSVGRPADEARVPGAVAFGRGMGVGRGFRGGYGPELRGFAGRGWGRNRAGFWKTDPETAPMEIDRLKMQAESLNNTLEAINQRLLEMEKSE